MKISCVRAPYLLVSRFLYTQRGNLTFLLMFVLFRTGVVGGDGDDRPNRPEMNKPDWQSPYYGNVLMSMLSN